LRNAPSKARPAHSHLCGVHGRAHGGLDAAALDANVHVEPIVGLAYGLCELHGILNSEALVRCARGEQRTSLSLILASNTAVAPRALADSMRCRATSVMKTCEAPNALATHMQMIPIGPQPRMSTRLPGCTPARRHEYTPKQRGARTWRPLRTRPASSAQRGPGLRLRVHAQRPHIVRQLVTKVGGVHNVAGLRAIHWRRGEEADIGAQIVATGLAVLTSTARHAGLLGWLRSVRRAAFVEPHARTHAPGPRGLQA
jgi:hypothetical protein